MACFLRGLGLAWMWAFLPFSPLFALSVDLPVFLPCHSVIPTTVPFDPCLLGLFRAYCIFFSQFVTMSQFSHWAHTYATLGFLGPLYCLWAPFALFFFLGHPWPISNSAFLWDFTNSFGLSWPNYHILHPWSSWAFHQPFTFLIHYFGPVVSYSYSSTSYNAHGFTASFFGLLWAHLLSSRSICLLYGPMTHYSYYLDLMSFLLILLTLSCPYCWASSYCWAFPKWASTYSYGDNWFRLYFTCIAIERNV